jgi:outer membrane protein TolC
MFRRLSAARADQQAVESAVSLAESNLDAQIAREFYDARRTALLVEVELRNLQNARRRLEDSEERFRIAAISQVDLLDAQRSLIGVEQALALAEANAEKARFALRQTLGLDASIPFEVAEEMPEVFDPSTLDAAALVTRALQQSPSVRQRLAAVEAARQNAAAARGARWPTISGGLGYDRSTSEDGYGAFGELNPNGRYGYSFSISVSFPLFTRFQTSQQIAQADAGREDAEQDLRRTRLDIERTIRSGLVDLGRWFRNFEAQQQIAALTQQQVELAEEQFRLGAMNFLQFQQVVDNNATAQRNAVDARFQFVAARLGLEQALGGPLGR